MATEHFATRHIGPRPQELDHMLHTIGVSSLDELIDKTVPSAIRLQKPLDLPKGVTEADYLNQLEKVAAGNKVFRNYIGMGYHPVFVPPVIQRNVLENPGWYTAYTPYQAEIAQGRLEALLSFQTMVSDLTGMELANASLLDEGTAAAETMLMFYHTRSKAKASANKLFVDLRTFPQTIDVLRTRAIPLGIELVIGDYKEISFSSEFFAAIIQYPNSIGSVEDYTAFTTKAKENEVRIGVATDLMALVLLTPPGKWGADAVFGNSQRFGVPMGYGGPHAAFFATHDEFRRHIPGRIIGVSKDRTGRPAFRMALQTREQHIRRDKATSNICTAQALLAVMAAMYAVYHGPDGLRSIAWRIHNQAVSLAHAITKGGYEIVNERYYDNVYVQTAGKTAEIRQKAEAAGINLWYAPTGDYVGIAINELTTDQDLQDLAGLFGVQMSAPSDLGKRESSVMGGMLRKDEILTHPVFNSYHSETEMMRFLKRLENKDLSLTHSMIPLGSCTMKLNAASELMPITWPEFANMHPFAPVAQAQGYKQVTEELSAALCEVTGFAGVSLQPNSGAQGEYAGLLVIRAYHESRGEGHRSICLIPSSAHGTNPASAVMAGMQVVVVKCDEDGNVDIDDLRTKAEEHSANLSCLMVTYPSTHGVFEEGIIEITSIVHEHGGQVYMDGANMNAQVGLTNPGRIGADVCHLNLHKTFAIPHGGGGPGMGPIGVAAHLVPFLPGNPIITTGGSQAIPAVSSAPWGSALILLISYAYIKMLGTGGLTDSTRYAILNANYIKAKLKDDYQVLYQGKNNTVAHEMIVDCREFKQAGIEVEDIAKRLMDYGFHAPTVSFPVAGTLMIEPTESESLQELDRFCDAMISIRQEIREVEMGLADKTDNVLKMAPHTSREVATDKWEHSYSRDKAAYPLPYLFEAKFWAPVARVDNAYGDRNLICTCPPMEMYEETTA